MKENNIQVIANNQMMNGALYGVSQTSDGLMYATRIEDIGPDPSRWITFAGSSVPPAGTDNYVRLEISAGTAADITFWQRTLPINPPTGWPTGITPGRDLDPNDKINLEITNSYFRYYNASGSPTAILSEIAQVEIRLAVRDKNLPGAPAVILRNTVTLRNIPQID